MMKSLHQLSFLNLNTYYFNIFTVYLNLYFIVGHWLLLLRDMERYERYY